MPNKTLSRPATFTWFVVAAHVCAQVNAPCPVPHSASLRYSASSRYFRVSAHSWAGLKLKVTDSLHRILSLNWEQAKRQREGKMLQTTKRNARIITLDARSDSGCNRRQGVDLKLKLIENSVRIPKRECRQQAQPDQQLHLWSLSL